MIFEEVYSFLEYEQPYSGSQPFLPMVPFDFYFNLADSHSHSMFKKILLYFHD